MQNICTAVYLNTTPLVFLSVYIYDDALERVSPVPYEVEMADGYPPMPCPGSVGVATDTTGVLKDWADWELFILWFWKRENKSEYSKGNTPSITYCCYGYH